MDLHTTHPTPTQTHPTLAFLIPSRGRFDGLLRTVRSLRTHVDSDAFEVRVWLDNDDYTSLERVPELAPLRVHVHSGPRGGGYDGTGAFLSQMAAETKAPWVCTCDDDNQLRGASFVEALRGLPLSGVYVTPEIFEINNCTYTNLHQYWMVPNGAWLVDSPVIHNPTDTWMYNVLVVAQGWRMHRLPGVIMHHAWTRRPD